MRGWSEGVGEEGSEGGGSKGLGMREWGRGGEGE